MTSKLRRFAITALFIATWVLLCLVPVEAQVTATGSIAGDTLNNQASIVTLPSAAAAVSISAATPSGTLSCTTYPVVKVYDTRNSQQLDLADFTNIANGNSWTAALNFVPLQQGDAVYAKITTAGTGCTNDSPITVSLIYMPAAGICYSNPSACVTITGFLTGPNGLASDNYTATFKLNQIGWLGGTAPPASSSGGGGGGVGLCESLGATAGDICYFDGAHWVILPGNESTIKFLSETSGVPSWQNVENAVSLEYEQPLDYTNGPYPTRCPNGDCIRTLFKWQPSAYFGGPPPPTAPDSSVIQSQICTLTSTTSGTPVVCDETGTAPQFQNPNIPGDTIIFIFTGQCGLGCVSNVFSLTASNGETFTPYESHDGSGNGTPTYAASAIAATNQTTLETFTFSTSPHPMTDGKILMVELRGGATLLDHQYSGFVTGGPPTYQSVTTAVKTTVLGMLWTANQACVIDADQSSGWGRTTGVSGNGTSSTLLSEAQNFSSGGTYTPAFVNENSCAGYIGTALTSAWTIPVTVGPAQPFPRLVRYPDLCAYGDFPCPSGITNGQFLTWNSTLKIWQATSSSAISLPFSGITSGTNTTAAMVVGAGASLDFTSTGTIDANKVNGATVPASASVVGTNSSKQLIAATSVLVTGIIDGTAPVTITTSTPITLGGTYKSGYTYNQHATAATAVTYNLPTAAAGLQYCVANSYNGSAADTGVLTVATSASGQFIIFNDGTLSASGGNVTSGGAGGDAACFVGVDSTHWQIYVQVGTWTKH